MATLNADGIVRLWDSRNGQEIRQLSVPSKDPYEIIFSPDGRYLAVSTDKTARIWDVEKGEQVQEFVGHSENVRTAFSRSATSARLP